uniref:ZP domain-containing protein n=1 Tax=Romanomermis culicivorax TaxID=13658 RepID=A0A915KKQ7_ROMCU
MQLLYKKRQKCLFFTHNAVSGYIESLANNVINNTLLGDPVVKCGPENIEVQASTDLPFEGVVYIKDWRKEPGCFENGTAFSAASNSTKPRLSVPLHDLSRCGMVMKRQADTGDVVIRGVWVFSFHPMFMWFQLARKRVNCIFKQKDVTVSSKFLVNDLSTKVIGRTSSMPSIAMKIISGKVPNPQLPEVSVVRVGDPLLFLWYLPARSSISGIRIKHCTAESRKGNRVQILNDGPIKNLIFVCPSKRKRVKRSIPLDESIYAYKGADDDIAELQLTILDSYNRNVGQLITAKDKRISFYKPKNRYYSKTDKLVANNRENDQEQNSRWVICMGRRIFTLLSSALLMTYIFSFVVICLSIYVHFCRRQGKF